MSNEAVQSYKNIVSFMGDRNTRKDSGGHAAKLLKNTLHAPEELRDEIFCQIMKQVTNNPDPVSTVRGWQLLAICAGTYPPSKEFNPYMMYFCQKHMDFSEHENEEIAKTATLVQKRIFKTQQQGPRINVPTNVEIQAVRHDDPPSWHNGGTAAHAHDNLAGLGVAAFDEASRRREPASRSLGNAA